MKEGVVLYNPIIFEQEIWKDITYYPDIKSNYEVSNFGRMRNKVTGNIITGHRDERGYVLTSFRTIYERRVYDYMHRIVMITFNPIENYNLYVINHKDGVKYHNWIWNLEWTTQKRKCSSCIQI